MAKALLKAMEDASLFAPFFKDPATWQAWRTVLKVLFGAKLTASEKSLFQQSTGRSKAFSGAIREAWLVCGRRSGKSFIAALIAVYLSAFRDYRASLSPGERGVVLVLAVNRDQARVIFRYIEAFFDQVPLLAKLVVSRNAESIELSNRVIIEVGTASYRSVRGRTVVAALCDEIAFWRDESSANPDREILDALRPAMATIAEPLLLTLSSPYARRGVLFDAVQKHYGNEESEVLVWKAPTEVMNPTISAKTIRDAYEADPIAAAAEWGADFRSDVASFLEEQWITSAIDDIHERPPVPTVRYWAFVDPSGGKRDSFTLAIAHQDSPRLILDLVREFRPPLNPDDVVGEIASLVRPYRCTSVTGDRYAGEWVAAAFKTRGIRYEAAQLTRSEIYLECGPWLAQGRIRLVDSPRLTVQLRQLERRTSILGKDAVNHPPGGSDDVANAAMGALWLASQRSTRVVPRGSRQAITDYNEFAVYDVIDNRSEPPRRYL